MAFKDTGRWQEQLCDTSNHRIFGGSSSGLTIFVENIYISSIIAVWLHGCNIRLAGWWPYRSEPAKECGTTYQPNRLINQPALGGARWLKLRQLLNRCSSSRASPLPLCKRDVSKGAKDI